MTTSILEDKPSLAVEVIDLIRKMHRHILQDNCQHCKHILLNENESGIGSQYKPTPGTTNEPIPFPGPTENENR